MTDTRIYLDHAATSWPKPAVVLDAMDEFARHCGAAAGRGHYRSAREADGVLTSVRREIADRIVAPGGDCISLHASGTAALNTAIHGLIGEGDHVVSTAAEHNSVLRPLRFLQENRRIRLTIVDCDRTGRVDARNVIDAVDDQTRLVAVTHASNVTGAIQPIEAIADALRSRRALLLCDAAQTFGYLPIDVSVTGLDLLAAPGHKGGSGPLGTAFLYASPRCQQSIRPSLQGGTGSHSDSLEMPTEYPAKLEPGNLNVPALAGWSAGLVSDRAVDRTNRHCRELAERLYAGLEGINGIKIHGQPGPLPIASITMPQLTPIDMATILDLEYGIETRAGFHCAARIHPCLGTRSDGTLRISGGASTTHHEIDAVVEALATVVAQVSLHSS